MALVYQCDVFCDVCSGWIAGPETQHANSRGMATLAKEIAKHNGWKRQFNPELKKFVDICPPCYRSQPHDHD